MTLNADELAKSLSDRIQSAIEEAQQRGLRGKAREEFFEGVVKKTFRAQKRKYYRIVRTGRTPKEVEIRISDAVRQIRGLKSGMGSESSGDFADAYIYRQPLQAEHRLKFKDLTELRPAFITNVLGPYLVALGDLQRVLSELTNRTNRAVEIRYITRQSAVEIGLDGAAEVIDTLKEDLIPWRRKNAKKIAELKQRELEAEIKKKTAEATEIKARSARTKSEQRKLDAEADLMRVEGRRQELENEKVRFELEQSKLERLVELAAKLQPDWPESKRLVYALKMLPAMSELVTNELEFEVIGPAPVMIDRRKEDDRESQK